MPTARHPAGVAIDFPTVEVTEGRARLLVPDVPRRKGPGVRGTWPFYNPTMRVNRDLSAVALANWPTTLSEVLDGLSGTGAWGIRIALEAGVPGLTFNEQRRSAAPLIRENLTRNGLQGEVLSADLREVLARRSFDFVDIDPFGPPTPFLDGFFRTARTPSGVGLTATDTAPLCGTYPSACLRRYGARPLRCPQGAEIGLRILLGYAERVARSHGKSLRSLVAFAAEHFLRILGLVVDATGDETKPSVGYVARREDGAFLQTAQETRETVGPLWLGHLVDQGFVRRLGPTDWTAAASSRLLARLQEEAEMPAFFLTTDELGKRLRGSPPPVERLLEALRDAGYRATRTHFDPRGVKTDAPYGAALEVFRPLMPP